MVVIVVKKNGKALKKGVSIRKKRDMSVSKKRQPNKPINFDENFLNKEEDEEVIYTLAGYEDNLHL